MPTNRPKSLRPLLLKTEYEEFATKLNKELSWNFTEWEFAFLFFLNFVFPALSTWFLVR